MIGYKKGIDAAHYIAASIHCSEYSTSDRPSQLLKTDVMSITSVLLINKHENVEAIK